MNLGILKVSMIIFVRHLYELVSKPPITAVYILGWTHGPTSLKLTGKVPENGSLEHELSIWCLAHFQGRTVGFGEGMFRHQILWQYDVYKPRPREILHDFVLFRNAFLCISGSSKILCALVKLDHLSPILCGKEWQIWLSSKIFSCRFQELVCSFNTSWHTEVFS